MSKPTFNDLAQADMSEEAKTVMEEAMQKSCDEQAKVMNTEEVVKLITDTYGDVLKRLSKT